MTFDLAELGHYALALAFAIALLQSSVPMLGAARRQAVLMDLAAPAALAQFLCVAIAFLVLVHAYVTSDFSLVNVFRNSHSAKPLLYKITGVWGNHEGSMLLWVLILTLYGAAVATFGGNLPVALRARVLAVHGMIGAGFLAFILFTSNPFLRLAFPPPDGQGLNPILQDPGLAIHPPFLYLGYVGFSMAFSFAVAALIEGRVDPAWARWVRPWTLVAWLALTGGIALGSWWAYYELGWGGWWAWDPVENASFMPWLSGTALVHSAIIVERRDAAKSWTIFLALVTFALSLLGTFLVRSGVLTSVHAFATDPARGAFILGLLGAVIGLSLLLFAIRAPALAASGQFAPVSREGALVMNNLLLMAGCLWVLLGTLYPLALDAFDGPKISIGAPYYNQVFVPTAIPLLVLMGIGPLLPWKRADLGAALARLKYAAGAVLAVGIGTAIATGGASVLAPLGLGLAVWIVGGVMSDLATRVRPQDGLNAGLARLRQQRPAVWGMVLGHLGMAITIAGITVSTAGKEEGIAELRPGQSLTVAGEVYRLDRVDPVPGPNFAAEQATITISRGDKTVAVVHPSQKFYPLQRIAIADTAIRTNLMADRYVVLGEQQASGGWIVRVYWNPLVPWIWGGALVMALGGLMSLADRRLRRPVRALMPQVAGAHGLS